MEETKPRTVKVMQREVNGEVHEVEIETIETNEQLLNHLHIIEIVGDDKEEETEELVGEKETKSKGKAKGKK